MLKSGLVSTALRALFAFGAVSAFAASPTIAAVQDEVSTLTAAIQAAVLSAQAGAAATGLDGVEATAAVEAAIQGAILQSGATPATVALALGRARAALTAQGALSASAATAFGAVQAIVTASLGQGGAPASGGQAGGPVGAPGSAGGGGGGGSDYRPVT